MGNWKLGRHASFVFNNDLIASPCQSRNFSHAQTSTESSLGWRTRQVQISVAVSFEDNFDVWIALTPLENVSPPLFICCPPLPQIDSDMSTNRRSSPEQTGSKTGKGGGGREWSWRVKGGEYRVGQDTRNILKMKTVKRTEPGLRWRRGTDAWAPCVTRTSSGCGLPSTEISGNEFTKIRL